METELFLCYTEHTIAKGACYVKKWKEVYCTSNMEKFFRAKNLLDAKNIAYRTNTIII